MTLKNDLPLIEVKEISWKAARKDFLLAYEKQAEKPQVTNTANRRISSHV